MIEDCMHQIMVEITSEAVARQLVYTAYLVGPTGCLTPAGFRMNAESPEQQHRTDYTFFVELLQSLMYSTLLLLPAVGCRLFKVCLLYPSTTLTDSLDDPNPKLTDVDLF